MSKKVRVIICSVLVLVAFCAGVFAYAHTQLQQENTANAEEGLPNYLVDKDGKIRVPVEPATADARTTRGTEDNPFFVLEIVPYEGMAEFGFHISGCEPIDVDAAARDMVDIPGGTNYYDIEYNVAYRFWPEDKPGTFTVKKPEEYSGGVLPKMTQYGTMTYVTDGSGNYNIVGGFGEGIDKTEAEYQPVAEGATGSFVWEPLSADQCFAMKDSATEKAPYEGEFKAALTDGTSFKMYFEGVEYVEGTGNKVTHKNTFLKESVGLAYEFDANGVRYAITDENVVKEKIEAYKSVVYTVTPEDLNINPELIDRADLIVITPKANMLGAVGSCSNGFYTYLQAGVTDIYDSDGKLLEAYKTDYKFMPYLKKHLFGYEEPAGQYGRKENKPGATFKTNLIDWSIVAKIAERAMDDTHMLPVIMENLIFQNAFSGADHLNKSVQVKAMYADGKTELIQSSNGTQENMAKLYLMLNQMKSSAFKSLYGNPADASNALFASQNMKVSGIDYQMKNNAYLQTGVFNYDNGRDAGKKATDDTSRVYWNDTTLIPWHVLPTTGYASPGEYAKAVAVFGITTYSNGYSMTSGDAQNILRNGLMGFSDNGKLTSGFDSMDCGIKKGIFGSQLYEYFDTINGDDPMPDEGDLTTADCLFYLLNGVNGGPTPVNDTTQYKILELQPTSSYETDQFWKMVITTYTNSIKDPIVDRKTTSEFIGSHVECISEYDLVYVGMKKLASDPRLDFPSEMTDFVYAHTGPKIEVGTKFRALYGWLRSGQEGKTGNNYYNIEKYFVYSGNDLTKLALKKLEDYNEAGFPILFGDGFYSSFSGGSYTMAGTIDRNSNVYKLGGIIDDAGSKAVYRGELTGGNPERAAELMQTMTSNSKRVDMVFAISPVLYDSNVDEKDRYINGYNNDYRTLYYKFFVKAPAGTSYKVRLFVDANTDGYFKEGQEDVGAEVLEVLLNGTEGGSISSGMVEAGKWYYVKRQVNNRIGSVVWKLELLKDGKVYAEESGVSAIQAKPDGTQDVHIKVLQIVPGTHSFNNTAGLNSLTLPTQEEIDAHEHATSPADQLKGSALKFYNGIKDLDGLDLKFFRMKQEEIATAAEGIAEATTAKKMAKYMYDNYDMLVLGFADIYNGVSDPDLLEAIRIFENKGKAVLYTHDTSSGISPDADNNTLPVWGRTITEAYREFFGMDRYGAKQYYAPDEEPEKVAEILSKKDKPFYPVSSSSDTGKTYTNRDDNASGRELIQGVANGMLYRTEYPENSDSDGDKNINSHAVTKVNTGAITNYPYTIPDTIEIASTHPQYYQLDMEHEDIVVWYCLAAGATTSTYEKNYFNSSKNDVRSDYYIYNKGNVTYSGMGHMQWGSSENSVVLPNYEIQLFINTFVAAYRAAAVGVKVEVVNDDATGDSAGDQYLCVDVDSSDADEIIGNDIVDTYKLQVADTSDGEGYAPGAEITRKSKRVYFRLVDPNTFGDAKYKVEMVLNNGLTLDGVRVDGTNEMFAVYERDTGDLVDCDDVNYAALKNGSYVYYYVDVPINIETTPTGVRAVGKTELAIKVTMTYKVGEEEITPDPAVTKVNILPRGFYRLN